MKIRLTGYRLEQSLPYILVVGGLVGVLSAAILTVEKFQLLRNPSHNLVCDLNPIISCGSVIDTWQASAFGFPNPIIGLIGFSIVITIGVAMLAGARFKTWFWRGLQAGVIFGVGFITWLQYQSIFHIHALCPFCMLVWSVTIPIFWYTTLYNFKQHHLSTPKRLQTTVAFAQRHHGDVLISWYLVIIGVITWHFWYYWSTLIS